MKRRVFYSAKADILNAQKERDMKNRIAVGKLNVDAELHALVKDEIAPGTGVDAEAVWRALGEIVGDLAPQNRRLLEKRDVLQAEIDAWHIARKGQPIDRGAYRDIFARHWVFAARRRSLSGVDTQCRSGNCNTGRPAVGRARGQCAVLFERGECALGQFVRRAVWDRRDFRVRRHGKGRGVQSRARRKGDCCSE